MSKERAARTEMVVHQPPPAPISRMTTPDEWAMIRDQGAWIARAKVYPGIKTPEGAVVAMLAIRDMEISMSLGLSEVFEIPGPGGGKIYFGAKAKLAALMTKAPGFAWEPVEWNEKVCHIRGRLHVSQPWKEFKYTREEADRSGYTKTREGGVKDNWQREPKLMLLYRCLTRWMTLYAIHVVMSIPSAVMADPGDPVETDFEVVETEPARVQAATEAPPAATPVNPPEPAPRPTDFRKAVAAIARKQGKTSNAQLLQLVGAVFSDLKLAAPRTYSEIGPSDWKTVYEELERRYDTETGQPRLKVVEREPKAEPTSPPEEAEEEAAPTVRKAAAPIAETEPVDLEVEALKGNVDALIEYAMAAEERFTAAEKPRRFVRENPADSGDWYFVAGKILVACGSCQIEGEGEKAVPLSALLATRDPELMENLATDGLRIMLARGVKQALDELEGGPRA